MSILVTGAAGFIGSHVCDRLLGRGETVVGFDWFDDFYSLDAKESNLLGALGSEAFSLIRGDIRDPEALEKAERSQPTSQS